MTHLTRRGRPLLRGLALALPATLLAALPAEAGSYGSTGAPDRKLRAGCQDYRYHYRLDASMSEHDWMLETFLDDPTGETLGSGAFFSDWDPRRGRGIFGSVAAPPAPGSSRSAPS